MYRNETIIKRTRLGEDHSKLKIKSNSFLCKFEEDYHQICLNYLLEDFFLTNSPLLFLSLRSTKERYTTEKLTKTSKTIATKDSSSFKVIASKASITLKINRSVPIASPNHHCYRKTKYCC